MADLRLPEPSRQLAFHELLVAARKTWLRDALSEALEAVDPDEVRRELADLVPRDAGAILAAAGIRDEYVFPTPTILRAKPTLLAYYRLLLGLPRKTFYGQATGFGSFASMEEAVTINARQDPRIPELCAVMAARLAELVRQISPAITLRDVDELPLLVLGGQFQGAANNAIGQEAIRNVFLAIESIVHEHVIEQDETRLVVENAAGRRVHITLSADPDVRIEEEFGDELRKKVAIEIKGGTDASNAHNRAGEAEKSHRKAHADGFRDFWTVIAKRGVDPEKLRAESPTTRGWFDASQVLAREGAEWDDFRSRIADVVGIPLGE